MDTGLSYTNFDFTVTHESKTSKERTGIISTPHGNINTPAFIFCGTKASMKCLTMEQMKELKSQIVLSNTYHLYVDGVKIIKKLGGLHDCTKWNGPMLTDSGGYQIFAMGYGSVSKEIKGNGSHRWKPSLKSIDETGAKFKSYKDQSIKELTPEKSIQIQRDLGADLILVFDECTPYNISKEYTSDSMKRSHRWASRSIEEYKKNNDENDKQALYGIIQGSVYEDLRLESIKFNNEQPYFGIAVGGSLGDSTEMMHNTVSFVMKHLDTDERPVHLLGIGKMVDIFHGVRQGIDTFDCVHPTRLARHGCALIKGGTKEHIDLTKSKFKDDENTIEDDCECPTCRNNYSRMYIRYLYRAKEKTSGILILQHNVWFMNTLMEEIRCGIKKGTLDEVQKKWLG
jgi:queuine tRNA-ribosyltransferase